MAEQDIKEICQSCKYFVTSNAVLGVCKRFPHYVNKHDADWCGEHVYRKTMADITREALAIAADGIDLKAIEEGAKRRKAQYEAMFAEEEKPKKRGRKPKDATSA